MILSSQKWRFAAFHSFDRVGNLVCAGFGLFDGQNQDHLCMCFCIQCFRWTVPLVALVLPPLLWLHQQMMWSHVFLLFFIFIFYFIHNTVILHQYCISYCVRGSLKANQNISSIVQYPTRCIHLREVTLDTLEKLKKKARKVAWSYKNVNI